MRRDSLLTFSVVEKCEECEAETATHLFKCMNLKVKCRNSSLENENHFFTLMSFPTCMTFSLFFFFYPWSRKGKILNNVLAIFLHENKRDSGWILNLKRVPPNYYQSSLYEFCAKSFEVVWYFVWETDPSHQSFPLQSSQIAYWLCHIDAKYSELLFI